MSIYHYLLSGSKFKKAKALTLEAQQQPSDEADKLFQQAYNNFSVISKSYSHYADAVYYWGFALLKQAQTKSEKEAISLLEEAINKFMFCKTLSPLHLGVAIDGGVALLELAKAKQVSLEDDLYNKAIESFQSAEQIQTGAASYNLACLYALNNDNDACLKALELAKYHGLIPEIADIINDADLKNVNQLPWFNDYIKSLTEKESEETLTKGESEEILTKEYSEEKEEPKQ